MFSKKGLLRKYIFQPVIFRGHVSFSGRNSTTLWTPAGQTQHIPDSLVTSSTHLHQEYLMPPAPTAWPQPWQLMPRCWLLWLKETSHWAARQCFFRLMLLLVGLHHRNPTPHKPTPTRKEGLMLWVVLWTIVDTWLSAPYWNPYSWVCLGGSWFSTDLDSIKDFSTCFKTKKTYPNVPKMKSFMAVSDTRW